ncbi:CAAX prenyl protease 2 [Ceratocystis fimbriata CBS 114723]|uniref:intramembrane prenyl-peptidase Rce1 n=1 Tax=Ceratocystis fimbriata CBS 114723 TaxID=1035309 RepID=A0A2C5X0J9_9PEZI|nr:CAAX prenyl protease 2 [Ceratocystis fimbriata CBS 114723]
MLLMGMTPELASGLLILYTIAYVAPLYASKTTRPSQTLNRDHPQVIRGRIVAVTISTIACNIASYLIISKASPNGHSDALALMGYWPLGITETVRTLLLNSILFAGPIFETLIIDGEWRALIDGSVVSSVWTNLHNRRNLVVGPITEEALFRSAAVPLFIIAGVSPGRTVFVTPVLFGLAHVHHFYEFRITHPKVPVSMALIRSFVQFAYTSVFGALATFFFLRTQSLLAVALLHAQCNALGLPRFWGSVSPYWVSYDVPSTSPVIRFWTMVYYMILLAGAIIWYTYLWPLSFSPHGIY